VDNPFLHGNRYGSAFLENDLAEMQRQVAAAAGKPGEDVLLSFASDTEGFYGRLANARRLSQRAIDSAHGNDSKETAAAWRMNAALREAEFGNIARARQEITAALAEGPSRDVSVLAALAFARIRDINRADRMAHDLAESFPLNTAINRYWLPAIYASIEIKRGRPTKAREYLESTTQYELGSPLPQFEVGGSLYPAYIRGEVYLLLQQGKEAATEFQKFLGHRGVALNSPLGALARLQLGRAYALQGNTTQSRAAYQDFFGLWRDADPDVPILIVAKSEYAKLK
jgi:tetratricopeptide (TPR) repeat protein